MKSYLSLSVLSTFLLLCVSLVSVKAQQAAASEPQTASAHYADEAIAAVGSRKITRRDIVIGFGEIDPKSFGSLVLDRCPNPDASTQISLDDLCRDAFRDGTSQFQAVLERRMIEAALEEAAAKRNLTVSESDTVNALHKSLIQRGKAMETSGADDKDLARKLGDRYNALLRLTRTGLLQEKLVRADLDETLGHPVSPDDFFSVHSISFRVLDKDGKTDPKATQAKVAEVRADILAKKTTFEDAAEKYNIAGMQTNKGNIGAVMRGLLKKNIETAILRLKPGEITPTMPVNEEFAIFRLDKRGDDLTQAERDRAVNFFIHNPRRVQDAVARVIREIPWSSTIGSPPEYIKQPTSAAK